MAESYPNTFYFLKLAGENLRKSIVGTAIILFFSIIMLLLAYSSSSLGAAIFFMLFLLIGVVFLFIYRIRFLKNLKEAKDLKFEFLIRISYSVFVIAFIIDIISAFINDSNNTDILLGFSSFILTSIGFICLIKYAADYKVQNPTVIWGFLIYFVFSLISNTMWFVEPYYDFHGSIILQLLMGLIIIIGLSLISNGIIKAFTPPKNPSKYDSSNQHVVHPTMLNHNSYPSGNLISNQEHFSHQEQEANKIAIFCPNCSTKISSDDRFCPNCGYKQV